MTVQLSPHKVGKILRGYFRGLPQTKIAKEAGVDQSSISHYASRFKETAGEEGILDAAKEFAVFEEVSDLRSLSVELLKSNLTTEEAKEGVKIIRAFNRLGVEPYDHINLVRVCKKVDDEEFIKTVLRFGEIEDATNKGYEEILSEFESAASQLPLVEKNIEEKKAELGTLNNILAKKKSELAGIQSQLVQFREETMAEKTRLNEELEAEMKRLSVKKQEVKEVANLKSEMVKRGINISTLMQVAMEFKV